jgi:hypothetical protein
MSLIAKACVLIICAIDPKVPTDGKAKPALPRSTAGPSQTRKTPDRPTRH